MVRDLTFGHEIDHKKGWKFNQKEFENKILQLVLRKS